MTREFNPPILIICRDRVEPLKKLLAWLEWADLDNIWLIDNESTYEPMVDFLAEADHNIIYTNGNHGQTVPWSHAKDKMKDYFVVTDPDIVPVEECPPDALDYFKETLLRLPLLDKVGFSLKIDDLPDHYAHKANVVKWESYFWNNRKFDGTNIFNSPVDTTFALYKANVPYSIENSARADYPYVARHLPWYMNSSNLTEEEEYYRHSLNPDVSNWNCEVLKSAYDV